MSFNSNIILVKNIKMDKKYRNVLSYSEAQMLELCRANKSIELTKYSFKLFKEDTNTPSESASSAVTTVQKGSVQQDTYLKTAFSKTSAKLWASFNPQIKNQDSFHYFDALKKGQWHQSTFLRRVLQVKNKQ